MLEGVKYLCIPAADSPSQNLCSSRRPEGDPQRTGKSMGCRTRHFKESIKFIHECRLRGEGCLVHCLAGVSRSVTLVIAYIMTVTDFGWEDALHTVRAGRSCANPNLGFQRQLQDFEKHEVHQYRQWLKEEYGESPLRDAEEARNILVHQRAAVSRPIPEPPRPRGRTEGRLGHRGEACPRAPVNCCCSPTRAHPPFLASCIFSWLGFFNYYLFLTMSLTLFLSPFTQIHALSDNLVLLPGFLHSLPFSQFMLISQKTLMLIVCCETSSEQSSRYCCNGCLKPLFF
ncbi:dual specificity protein phosphatase 22 isoform X1 [Equus przewalskii]|uniref:Dual specificity protein phosphatase 22 isoform X1 n=1 Tax=Equus przewalskii TaxID=9798 RepID=A0ABM2F1M5_EQUPR